MLTRCQSSVSAADFIFYCGAELRMPCPPWSEGAGWCTAVQCRALSDSLRIEFPLVGPFLLEERPDSFGQPAWSALVVQRGVRRTSRRKGDLIRRANNLVLKLHANR